MTADGRPQTVAEVESGRPPAVGGRVIGARVLDLLKDEEIEIHADMVVNAAGAWCGQITASVGVQVQILPGKGTMVAMNHRVVNTVVNRCKLPGDGDILVPAHTVAIIGTTDVKVPDPDHYAIEPWEVQLMLEEGEKMVPGFKDMRMLRAWAGVRPLFKETKDPAEGASNRDVTRAFVLLDHEQRDGLGGLVTITSGKWTTYRKMAEVTVDLVCAKLGVQRECRTHLEPLPGAEEHGHFHRAVPLAEVEKEEAYGALVCECELATRDEVVHAITAGGARTIDDVRRDSRLGMGPCQGGFCTYRVAGLLHSLQRASAQETNAALRDFLKERWKGLLPILWGQQLRQERLDELIYQSVLNASALPGPKGTRLGPVMYEQGSVEKHGNGGQEHRGGAEQQRSDGAREQDRTPQHPSTPAPMQKVSSAVVDVLVVGAGFAGLAAGWRAAEGGRRVRVIAKGWGAMHWNAGCVDVLGYLPSRGPEPVVSPEQALVQLIRENPRHPYALAGLEQLGEALSALQEVCARAGYPLHGSLERNWLLPTALGTLRPACLIPETMLAGDCSRPEGAGPVLIAGFERHGDFFPALIAANLEEQGIPARGISLDLASLRERRFYDARLLAWKFENPAFREEVASALKPRLEGAARVGFPALLGLRTPIEVLRDLEARLEVPVFEIPTLPASIPGIRLHNILIGAVQYGGGRVFEGMQVLGAETADGRVAAVWSEAAARRKAHPAGSFVLATGGLLGGGAQADYNGLVREVVFNLPMSAPVDRATWFHREFLAAEPHPIYCSGLEVDESFRPAGGSGQPVFDNLYTAGSALAHFDPIRERSLEGVALVTGYLIGNHLSDRV
jgi:anaerobic glycerol-3-phosphate dehydrogenase B subunit